MTNICRLLILNVVLSIDPPLALVGPGEFFGVDGQEPAGARVPALWYVMLSRLRCLPLKPCKPPARFCAVPLPFPVARHAALALRMEKSTKAGRFPGRRAQRENPRLEAWLMCALPVDGRRRSSAGVLRRRTCACGPREQQGQQGESACAQEERARTSRRWSCNWASSCRCAYVVSFKHARARMVLSCAQGGVFCAVCRVPCGHGGAAQSCPTHPGGAGQ